MGTPLGESQQGTSSHLSSEPEGVVTPPHWTGPKRGLGPSVPQMLTSWFAIFFHPDVLLTAFVSFFFFLSCFAMHDPEVLLWAIAEAAKKLPWRKRSEDRRQCSPPSPDHRNDRPARSDATTAGPAARSVLQQSRTPASTNCGNAYSSDSSACSPNGHAYGEAAYLSRAEVRSARQHFRVMPPLVRSEPSMKRVMYENELSSLGKSTLGSVNRGMRPTARCKESPRGRESRSRDHAGRTSGCALAEVHQSERKPRPEGSMVNCRDVPAPSIMIVEGSCPFVQKKTPPISA